MVKKRKIAVLTAGVLCTVGISIGVFAFNSDTKQLKNGLSADETSYTLIFNKDNRFNDSSSEANGTANVTTSEGNTLEFEYTHLDNSGIDEDGFQRMVPKIYFGAENSTIRNKTAISGLRNITINFEKAVGGYFRIGYGWTFGEYSIYQDISNGVAFNFNNEKPNYFSLDANTTAAKIKSITLTYSCVAESTKPIAYGDLSYLYKSAHYEVVGIVNNAATAINIPDEINGIPVTAIGPGGIDKETTITSVHIGKNIKSLGYSVNDNPLQSNKSVQTITVSSENTNYKVIDSALYQIDDSGNPITLIRYPAASTVTSITVPNTVTKVSDLAMRFAKNLVSFTFADSVYDIGNNMFEGAENLENVTLPNNENFTSMKYSFFSGCKKLTSIEIPSSVTRIQHYVFNGCESLTSVTIPESVVIESSNSNMFSNCTNLTEVTIPSSTTIIPNYMFRNCSALTTVNFPISITKIGTSAFDSCVNLSGMFLILSTCTTINSYAFNKCSKLTIATPLSMRAEGWDTNWLGSSSHPELMPKVYWSYGEVATCGNLICMTYYSSTDIINYAVVLGLVETPSTVDIEIPITVSPASANYTVKDIAPAAFKDRNDIETININAQIKNVGASAFEGLSLVKSITFKNKPEYIGPNAFKDVKCRVFFPGESAGEDWDSNWDNGYLGIATYNFRQMEFAGIYAVAFTFEDDDMNGYIVSYKGSETNVSIPYYLGNKIYEIGYRAFANKTSIQNLTMSGRETFKTIAESAFEGCTSITSINISESYIGPGYASSFRTLGPRAFKNCSSLTGFEIPASIDTVGDECFEGCTSLESAKFTIDVINAGNKLFENCPSLNSIKVYWEKGNKPAGWANNWLGNTGSSTLEVFDLHNELIYPEA